MKSSGYSTAGVSGKIIQTPINLPIDDVYLRQNDIAALQAIYMLSEADFLRLKNKRNIFFGAFSIIGSAFLGYLIPKFPDAFNNFLAKKEMLPSTDYIIIGFWFVVIILLYALSFFIPSENKTIMKKIEKHFKDKKTELNGNK